MPSPEGEGERVRADGDDGDAVAIQRRVAERAARIERQRDVVRGMRIGSNMDLIATAEQALRTMEGQQLQDIALLKTPGAQSAISSADGSRFSVAPSMPTRAPAPARR